ncbi:hypothetical protein MTO96_051255 [Rhipicephalus appendiculatus]
MLVASICASGTMHRLLVLPWFMTLPIVLLSASHAAANETPIIMPYSFPKNVALGQKTIVTCVAQSDGTCWYCDVTSASDRIALASFASPRLLLQTNPGSSLSPSPKSSTWARR